MGKDDSFRVISPEDAFKALVFMGIFLWAVAPVLK